MRARLELLGSIAVLWVVGVALGTAAKAVASGIHPKTVVVFASAVAPTYALRVGLRSAPEQFDFDRFAEEVERETQLQRHAAAAALGVAAGTVAGAVTGSVVDATVAGIGPSPAMLAAIAVSWVVGLRALVSLNATYRVS
ncbi:hypothetical protein [Halobacterium salinarum]|uniref:Uncharacterized protein n=1 Tax=Halobacterium salinarum (strain ATCC 33171 / DSM 3754 / JCM 8978 / NBRC 102687 / NCIMB 764 / 91-R6) TaxID=2597657 RepID=A0A4D6GSY1_HALS9|nr:hypothetical protein [Halobacterium salinarum]QCC44874.1 uncharacterized protein HBSAL_06060 [Halobacterium salinarum]TYO75542.1 hypothetical protein APQ99_01865 [Halobacterium salinarum DSM 3754]